MNIIAIKGGNYRYRLASDIQFDGIRMEILYADGTIMFDVSLADAGDVSVNTFGKDVSFELVESAVSIARSRMTAL